MMPDYLCLKVGHLWCNGFRSLWASETPILLGTASKVNSNVIDSRGSSASQDLCFISSWGCTCVSALQEAHGRAAVSYFFLEVLKARLDEAWSNQVEWKVSLPTAGGWNEMVFKAPSKPNHAVIQWITYRLYGKGLGTFVYGTQTS